MDTILEMERFLLAGGIDIEVFKEKESILLGGRILIGGRCFIPRLEYLAWLGFLRINVMSLFRLLTLLAGLEFLVMLHSVLTKLSSLI